MTTLLLADIGATQARFAILSSSSLGPVSSLAVAAFQTIESALRHFLDLQAGVRFDGAILAVAGPIEAGRCVMTNSRWVIDTAQLQALFGFRSVRLINDLVALAYALPLLTSTDVSEIGFGKAAVGEPVAVVAPGTGLGMACLLGGQGERALASEGGHATLAASNARQAAMITVLQRRFGHVSAERVLSGAGIVNLYAAIGEIEGVEANALTPAQITRAALDGTCALCCEALDAFCAFLGAVAGDAALMFGARGGIYVGGGIVPRIIDYIGQTSFRMHFEAKGRFSGYLATVPIKVIQRPDPAFLGLAALGGLSHG